MHKICYHKNNKKNVLVVKNIFADNSRKKSHAKIYEFTCTHMSCKLICVPMLSDYDKEVICAAI